MKLIRTSYITAKKHCNLYAADTYRRFYRVVRSECREPCALTILTHLSHILVLLVFN